MIINSYRTFQQDCKLVKEAGGDWWRVEIIPEQGGAGLETGSCVGLVSGGGEETAGHFNYSPSACPRLVIKVSQGLTSLINIPLISQY